MQFELPPAYSNRAFLTTKDLVNITGRSKSLFANARRTGKLNAVKLGARAVAFPVADVVAFLSSNEGAKQ